MKKIVIIACITMMSVMTMQAQKIDQRLTALVQQSTTRHHAQDKAISREAVTDRVGVKLNGDGTVCTAAQTGTSLKAAHPKRRP